MIPARILLPGLAISLALTFILELSYAWFWGMRGLHDFLLAAAVNMLTNPIVVFVYYLVWYRRFAVNRGLVTLGLEIWAVVTEALLYRKYAKTIRRPWLFSLSVNAFSYAAGELINALRAG